MGFQDYSHNQKMRYVNLPGNWHQVLYIINARFQFVCLCFTETFIITIAGTIVYQRNPDVGKSLLRKLKLSLKKVNHFILNIFNSFRPLNLQYIIFCTEKIKFCVVKSGIVISLSAVLALSIRCLYVDIQNNVYFYATLNIQTSFYA